MESELEQTPNARRDSLFLSPGPSLLGPQAASLTLSTDSRDRAPGQTGFSPGKMMLEEARSFNV